MSIDWNLHGEFRPRFSSFHGRLQFSRPFRISSMEALGSNLLIKDSHSGEQITLPFPQDLNFSGQVSYLRQGSQPNEVLFALRTLDPKSCKGIKDNEFALLSPEEEDAEETMSGKYPFSLPAEDIINKELQLQCKVCAQKVLSIEPLRVAPLPSSDWKEGAASWFCGCRHDPSKIIKLADSICNGVIMWTDTSILIPNVPQDSVICRRCQQPLGVEDKDAPRFWLSCIRVYQSNGDSILFNRSPEATFMSFVNEALRDSPTLLVPKVVLQSKESVLCMRIMEKNLIVVCGASHLDISSSSAYKLLYAEGKNLQKGELDDWLRFDARVSLIQVPEQVISTGLELLEKNQAYLHPDDHQATGFKISIIAKDL